MRKILSISDIVNKAYEKVSIELQDNYDLNELKINFKEEGSTQVNIVINDKDKIFAFQVRKSRKFDYSIFNA